MKEGKIFLERELSYKLVGCFYKVRNLYSSGCREKFYDKVLDEVFIEAGISFIDKPKIQQHSLMTGKIISYLIPDKLIEDKILVELKAKPFSTQEDINQSREYLKTTKYEIIYYINFGEEEFKPKRFIYTNDRKNFFK